MQRSATTVPVYLEEQPDGCRQRAAIGIALISAFALTWANFVQFADVTRAAAMYFIVPIVAGIGAAVARLQPDGMARALFVTAFAQASVLWVVLVMLIRRNPQITTWTPPELRGFCGNTILVLLFAGSALLFRKAGRGMPASGWIQPWRP
jgi:hypothetical protein